MSYDPRLVNDAPRAAATWSAPEQAAPVGAAGMPRQQPQMPQQQPVQDGASQRQAATIDQQPPAATPNVDVIESEAEVVVMIEVPGFSKDEITVQADASNLYVTAERSTDPQMGIEGDDNVLLRECPDRLERAITLPNYIDPGEATAEHVDGVCHVTVPKDEAERQHEIAFQ
ncbi:Hsp20/alpha crystallin family protein [Halobacterium sp. MBLA0001]|uniref:Hsp20/alpha crystallin family protein n=1 Tax=Halobacterium TaxID=2239 RepID=UPI002556F4A6|nr:Hsp20/alpha crystallin family protein [Halobacterium salinarum]MDL0128129.1 Hsp20/alpha crystallin family protein [Halobacterium salinarum]MDL0134013.1 Hsp20/alpha crystallin family protein [Halobacterium salinarum]